MNSTDGYYEFATWGDALYVRVVGLATMYNVGAARELIARETCQGRKRVIFDLVECEGMDSTFLGVIAGVALDEAGHTVDIINVSDENRRLLEGLGLTELVNVVSAQVPPPEGKLTPIYDRTEETGRLELVLSAHNELVKLSEENEAVFGDLIREIEKEAKEKGLPTGKDDKPKDIKDKP